MKNLFFIYTLVLSALLFNLTGCGSATYQVSPEFQPYVDDFESASIRAGKPVKANNLIIEFGQASEFAGATCYQETRKTPRIAVDENTWKVMTENQRKQALFHEMGHCVLNRNHKNDIDPVSNCNTSLMSASPVPESCINSLGWSFYENELFNF